jgi:hypothetical protein
MARYYLLTGYLIKASHKGNNISLPSMPRKSAEKIYRKQGIPVPPKPKNYSLLKISSNLEIKVVYTDLNYGHLLIRASSRREAYSIAFAIIGYFGNFVGWPSEYVRLGYFLPEFNRMPNPSWTRSDLLRALREVDYRANELSIPELTTTIIFIILVSVRRCLNGSKRSDTSKIVIATRLHLLPVSRA